MRFDATGRVNDYEARNAKKLEPESESGPPGPGFGARAHGSNSNRKPGCGRNQR